MGRKKQVLNNSQLNQGLAYNSFVHVTSNTIFTLGSFVVTSNFDEGLPINNGSKLKSFSKPITLEKINLDTRDSELLNKNLTEIILNTDNSDIKNFVRFGSAYEFIRSSIENILLNFPASIYINSQKSNLSTYTINDFVYNSIENYSTFHVYANSIDNKYNLIYTSGNTDTASGELRNLNLSYNKYVMWSEFLPNDVFKIIGFTGSTKTSNLFFKVEGNPLSFNSLTSSGNTVFMNINFHIKPNNYEFEIYRENLNPYERYLISERDGFSGFIFNINTPIVTDGGDVIYGKKLLTWPTTDKYNIDIDTSKYRVFLEAFLNIADLFDNTKTDLINRILTTSSLKIYDSTDQNKMVKLLRIYGKEFDKLRELIDSLLFVNTVTYDKKYNVPDSLISNLASLFGWDYQSIIDDNLLNLPFRVDDNNDRNKKTDLLPSEINTELWRRILINSNYFWKGKGTREVIKTMFLILGIPEEFININEYVYIVNEKINPSALNLSVNDFISIPYDSEGYPTQLPNNSYYYFQMNGNADGGKKYLNEYKKAGFILEKKIDNKKCWFDSNLVRSNNITPEYVITDNKLLINTKEIDIALEASQGLEFDIYYDYVGSGDTSLNDFHSFITTTLNSIGIGDIKVASIYPKLLIYLNNYSKTSQNKYSFQELFNYLTVYDAYFNRFISSLVPSTIITNKVGISVKNPSFLRQKFQYKRGVFINSGTTLIDLNNYTPSTINGGVYLGEDNPCYYRKNWEIQIPPPPPSSPVPTPTPTPLPIEPSTVETLFIYIPNL